MFIPNRIEVSTNSSRFENGRVLSSMAVVEIMIFQMLMATAAQSID